MAMSRIVHCDICEAVEVTHRAVLPDDWITLWQLPYTLCDSCVNKWETRFGETPFHWLKGGEVTL